MGSKGSKLDEQEAVALCRARVDLLATAVRHRYALADAHDALGESLASVAEALHLLMTAPGQPRVALLDARKDVDAPPPASAAAANASSPPHSSSHINFAPSSSDSESGSVTSSPTCRRYDQLPHHPPPLLFPHYGYGYAPELSPYGGYPPPGSLRLYYARSRPPPASVAVVEQRAVASERVYYGFVEPAPGGDARYYSYGGEPAGRAPPPPSPPSTTWWDFFSVFGDAPYYSYGGEPAGRAPPPPPSPPPTTWWDFFDVFGDYDVYDNYCYDAGGAGAASAAYTPSRSSREVREEEGIPDLEDDDAGGAGAASAAYTPSRSSREVREEEDIPDREDDDAVVKQVAGEFSAPGSGARSRRSSLGGVSGSIAEVDQTAPTPRRAVDTADVAGEIRAQFGRAADAVRALSPALEVGRRRYHHRSSVYHVSSSMVSAIAGVMKAQFGRAADAVRVGRRRYHHRRSHHVPSSMVSAIALSHSDLGGIEVLDVGSEKVLGGRSLSLTLEKLYMWEKKLYDEVKAEEKMRLLLAKNAKRLKYLDLKGAEAQKIDTTRNVIRNLSVKSRISLKIITNVSKRINRVRNEELRPQINALIQGFVRMLLDKLDCYQIQCQVISEAKNLDSIVPDGSNRELALELELQMIKWIINFSSWVNELRSFVKALNGWLSLCLDYKTEETVDGVPPYSPGRVGAPLVFVICNSWAQAMDRFSEKEVVTSMQALVSTVRKLLEKQNVEQMEQMIATRERERWNKILEKKTVEINKEADVLNKKLALVPGRHSWLLSAQTYQEHLLDTSSLQSSLQRVFQALRTFTSSSLQAFEQTLRHAEEERSSRKSTNVS